MIEPGPPITSTAQPARVARARPRTFTPLQRERLGYWLRACRYESDEDVLAARPGLPLVVGEAPNRSGAGTDPREIFATGRLARYGDIARFERVNILTTWPGSQGSGSAFPLRVARPAARDLSDSQPIGRPFLLVGTRVAAAFGIRRTDYEYLDWRVAYFGQIARRFAVCPHPSGLNRWWNEAANILRAEAFFNEIGTE